MVHGGLERTKKRVRSGSVKRMRSLYATCFKHYRMLPDEVGRQRPYMLFTMLDDLEEEAEYTGGNAYLDMFYGN